MSWKVWRWYLVAAVATLLACWLWLVVFAELRDSPSPSHVLSSATTAAFAPAVVPGRLPLVPVLRTATDGYGPGDPVYDAQMAELRAGRLFCAGGLISRRVDRGGGVVAYVAIETDRGPLLCR